MDTIRTRRALAAPGKEMENGITLFLDEQKQTLGGRPVQLTVLDSDGTPAHSPRRAQGRPASEHGDTDHRERESVLDVPEGGLPQGGALFANVSSVSALLR